jgi:drug/metabolite transporter (DMT)-like permease
MLDALPLWAGLALLGGLAQTTRNATAQTISRSISPTLNSWSRFAFCLPWAAIAVVATATQRGWPALDPGFLAWCFATALTQLLANVALVTAFRRGSFGESIVFHKLEVLLTAIVGALFFAEVPSTTGALGIAVCAIGVVAINLAREGAESGVRQALRFGPAGAWALLCAILLVGASFSLKLANQALRAANPEADFFEGAIHTLFHTTWIEVVVLSAWIARREPGGFVAVRRLWPRMLLIGSAGFTASLCWFWSFSITIVAYAKAVGQIEALLAVGVGILLMGERELLRQLPGIALTMLGILLVLLG